MAPVFLTKAVELLLGREGRSGCSPTRAGGRRSRPAAVTESDHRPAGV
ncbi:hypothetical protein [Streptomyces laculatispora]|nr:hypothetical protein [Streptomyces laculatispora]MBO0914388.1 hypothetical protein [Streptomyces laculatispora]